MEATSLRSGISEGRVQDVGQMDQVNTSPLVCNTPYGMASGGQEEPIGLKFWQEFWKKDFKVFVNFGILYAQCQLLLGQAKLSSFNGLSYCINLANC